MSGKRQILSELKFKFKFDGFQKFNATKISGNIVK